MATTADQEAKLLALLGSARASIKIVELLATTVKHMVMLPSDCTQQELVINAKKWADSMLEVADVRVEVEGDMPPQGVLQISNHRSFMDILVLLSASPAVYLAKAEISNWPIIGRAAQLAGTVFVKREEKGSRKAAREAIAGVLKQGISVTVFPEGTTAGPPGTLPFKPGSFQVAADLGAPVQLIALEYPRASDSWTGNEAAGAYFMRVFHRPVTVRVKFGPILEGGDSATLCELAKEWIDEELAQLARELHHDTPQD